MSWNFQRCSDISGMYVENDVQASSSGITELYGERTLCTLECELGSGIYGKMFGRILFSFKELESSGIPGVLRTDSDLSIRLLRGLGLPWNSQFLEIWTEWLQERVELGELRIHYERGSNNPADALAPWDG